MQEYNKKRNCCYILMHIFRVTAQLMRGEVVMYEF